jgi:hypothetical protein
MPRQGVTYTLVADRPNALQRITPSSETTIVLERDCNALLLAATGSTVYVSVTDTAASPTNGFPVVVAQPFFLPLGRVGCANGKLRAFSTAGSLVVQQLA